MRDPDQILFWLQSLDAKLDRLSADACEMKTLLDRIAVRLERIAQAADRDVRS